MEDVDVIFNPDTQTDEEQSIIEPKMMHDVTVLGKQNIHEIARSVDVEKVIYASTSEVHGVRPMSVCVFFPTHIISEYSSRVFLLAKVPS